ncbi:MAG: hypothetical protein SGI72_04515 [Planctomycetota bacterium]|nr:hypothetical protein [Planctomycetota bacterium]
MIATTLLALALVPAVSSTDPIRVGFLVSSIEDPLSPDARAVAAAQLVVSKWNADGEKVRLAVETCPDEAALAAAIAKFDADETLAIVAPLEERLAEATRHATRNKIATVSFVTPTAHVLGTLDELFDRHFQTMRIGVAHDSGKELAKLLQKGGLVSTAELVLDIQLGTSAKALTKELERTRPELIVVDGEAREASKFLREVWNGAKIPLVFTPRAFDAGHAFAGTEAWILLGRSLETVPGNDSIRAEFAAKSLSLGFGASEGFEALSLIQRAASASTTLDRAGLLAALAKATFDGPRGRVQLDPKLGAIVLPLAVWRLAPDALTPYAPPVVPIVAKDAPTAVAASPDPTFGVPLGTWRARQFALEPDTQWVVCRWALDPAFATIDDDLAELGLSTKGASPLFEHIVKDELMARIIAITNSKFLRNDDGTAVAGQSFRISFSTREPKKSAKFWWANFGGDHTDAGGEAFGTHCNVYSLFIRRTIFQPHALKPPAGVDDLKFVDGTYRFGTDRALDKRFETIRALINGYAGSMALTTAHEVGHLCTLDHVTDDPADIMNVNEGGGLDHTLGRFGATSYPRLVKVLGLSGSKK